MDITVEQNALPSLPHILKVFHFESKKKKISTFFQALPSPPKFCFSWNKLVNSAKCINRFNYPFLFTERHRWRNMLLTQKKDSRESSLKYNSNSGSTLHCFEKNLGDSSHQVAILYAVQCLFPQHRYSSSGGELTPQGLALLVLGRDNYKPRLYQDTLLLGTSSNITSWPGKRGQCCVSTCRLLSTRNLRNHFDLRASRGQIFSTATGGVTTLVRSSLFFFKPVLEIAMASLQL